MYNFISHENWQRPYPTFDELLINEDKEVTVLRNILFFYAEQKTKISNIRENFTEHAINKLIHDKFIKIHD